jgi:transcriptional regulator with XRE-family HTH domain
VAEPEKVVSLAERLRARRDELGISQSQAARELDVARTAYRLWEMEAAKPSPDRWRLIASWLGVSVTTMLLAEELVSAEEAAMGELAAADFARSGRDWDTVGAANSGDFFSQATALIEDGARSGDITSEQASALTFVLERVQQERQLAQTEGWAPAELRRTLAATAAAPKAAREALKFVAEGIPDRELKTGCLLISELVTNSVRHGPQGSNATVEFVVTVERAILRAEVVDDSPVPARPRSPGDDGGYGLTLLASLAARWGAGLENGRNVTWFELDLPLPGSSLG